MKYLIQLATVLCLFILSANTIYSQDFSNKGKDFWIAYGNHVRMFNAGGAEKMQIYITSDVSTTGNITIPSIGFNQNYTVNANQITTIDIPRTAALLDEGLYNHGIHVTSVSPVVVYSFIYVGAISGATLCLPTTVLGREYYSINYTQLSNEGNSYSYFAVVATEDNTNVEIIPSQTTKSGRAANVAFDVTLNQGQIYQVLSTGDLTGSKIQSKSVGANSCKRIGVFSGSGKISLGCTGNPGSSDNLYQQCYPNNAWGKNYITTPSTNNGNNFQTNFFRIIRPDPTANVTLNGTLLSNASFTNNFYHQFSSNTTNVISSDKPIMVAQYFTTSQNSANCGNSGIGDPEMIYLNPTEQTISRVTLNSMQPPASQTQITTHFVNIVLRNLPNIINSFKVDGISYPNSFVPVLQDPTYAYARIPLASQGHTITCDSGFNAIAYGFGSAESYGYSAGTNVIDLYAPFTLQNQFTTINFPSTCVNTPFKLKLTFPYQTTNLSVNFGSNVNISPNTTYQNTAPVPDSSFVKDGRTFYVYFLPGLYTGLNPATVPFTIQSNNPTTDGCSGTQERTDSLVIFGKPGANFTNIHTGCQTDSVKFFDATGGNRPVVRWNWAFGDGTIDSVKNPVKYYTAAGTYNVKLTAITDIGCIDDSTKPIAIGNPPLAKFSISDTVCIGKSILLTDSSTITNGTIAQWIWDYGDGTADTLTTNAPRVKVYNTNGPFTIKLKVVAAGGCNSNPFAKTIFVNNNPVPDFTFGNICLPIGRATFANTTTLVGTGVDSIKYQWNFGDGGADTAKNPTHFYTTTGPFTVKLTAITNNGCKADSIKLVNTIFPQPKAGFSISNEVCLRDTTIATDTSNGMGSAITNWNWNMGDGSPIVTTQNPRYAYASADTFSVKLFVITDKGCLSDTATRTTIANKLPTIYFKTTTPLCEQRDVLFTDSSTTHGAGVLTNWYWEMGNNLIKNLTSAAPFNHSYDTAGNYTIRVAVMSSKGCKSDTTVRSIYINNTPTANFGLPEVCLADAFAEFPDSSSIENNTALAYAWNFGDANATPGNPNTSTQQNPRHKYTQIGNYNVTLITTSNVGCKDTLAQSFTVNGAIPVAKFSVIQPASLCANVPVKITNTSTVDFGTITKVEIVWDLLNAPLVIQTDNLPVSNAIYSHQYPVFHTQTSKQFTIRLRAFSGGSCVSFKDTVITVNPSPKAVFLTNPGICLEATPRTILLGKDSANLAGSFTYSGAGIASNGVFTPNSVGAGTYTLQYLYTTNNGCKDSATSPITVWPSPTAKWGYSNPTCERNAITFTDSSVANYSNIIRWRWIYGDGTPTDDRTNSNSFTHTYTVAGTYAASLQVTTDSGCVSIVNTQSVKVNYLPIVSFEPPVNGVCLPDGRALFTNNTSIADGTDSSMTYAWNFGDVNDPTGSLQRNPTHRYTNVGNKTVKLIVTSNNGCVDSLTKVFNKIYPQPQAAFTPSPTFVCIGAPIQFTDNSNGLISAVNSWTWLFGDGSTSTAQNPLYTYTTIGRYNAKLIIKNQQGCISDTAEEVVDVFAYPTVNAGPDIFVLEGGTQTINAAATGNNLSYLWTPSIYLSSSTVLKPMVAPLLDKTYTLSVTGEGNCTVSDNVFVKVLLSPSIPSAFSPNGDNINDTWRIEYLDSYPGCTVEVFNRAGQIVFSSKGYTIPWDGTLNGNKLPVATYYYIVDPKNGRNKMSGSVTILR